MVKWATSTKVAINWLNRAQNISVLTLCEATTGVCTKVSERVGGRARVCTRLRELNAARCRAETRGRKRRMAPQTGERTAAWAPEGAASVTDAVRVFRRQNEEPLFSKDGQKLFFTRAVPQGGRGKFFHISMSVSQVRRSALAGARRPRPLRPVFSRPQANASADTLQSITSGDWDVTCVLAYNEDSQLM